MSDPHWDRAVVVVNPNSSQSVTDGMERALAGLRRRQGREIRCVTLAEGLPGIETDAHVRDVVAPLVRLIERMDDEAAAFVNACFSDPGLSDLRQATDKPVFGIAECAYRHAAGDGRRFGVISILEASVARHRRYIEALGLDHALAADRPVGLGVTVLGEDEGATLARLIQVGERLKGHDGADVIVLGCSGMSAYQERLESALAIPVIDPVRTAVEAAIAAV